MQADKEIQFSMSTEVTIYTDGAARGNPGKGGYGVVLMSGNRRLELAEGFRLTTNNRMELMAVIAGLKALKKTGMKVTVCTDSQYVAKAINEGWLKKWLANGFAKGIKNKDLWMQFHELSKTQHLKFVWVKGHADNPHNNRCDELATAAADGNDLAVDTVYESGVGKE
jgi:ribonuclease HI